MPVQSLSQLSMLPAYGRDGGTSSASTPRSTRWISSPWWDALWILNGLWLIPMVLGLTLMTDESAQLVTMTCLTGLWLAHRVGTTYLCATKLEYAPLLREQSVRFVVVPLAIFALFLLFFFDPARLIPLAPIERAKLGLSAYFFVNGYHFSMQHFGVMSIYQARTGHPPDPIQRTLERYFCLLVPGIVVSLGLVLRGSVVLDSTLLGAASESATVTALLPTATIVGTSLSALSCGVLLRSEWRARGRSWPKLLYIASVGVQGILVFFMDPLPFFLLWSLQHWLVAIGITVRMAPPMRFSNGLTSAQAAGWYGGWARFNQHGGRVFGILVAISVLMAPLFIAATNPEKVSSVGAFFAAHGTLANLFLTLSVGSAFVHLNMDRAVFRFSNAAVRQVSLPLLFR